MQAANRNVQLALALSALVLFGYAGLDEIDRALACPGARQWSVAQVLIGCG